MDLLLLALATMTAIAAVVPPGGIGAAMLLLGASVAMTWAVRGGVSWAGAAWGAAAALAADLAAEAGPAWAGGALFAVSVGAALVPNASAATRSVYAGVAGGLGAAAGALVDLYGHGGGAERWIAMAMTGVLAVVARLLPRSPLGAGSLRPTPAPRGDAVNAGAAGPAGADDPG